MHELENHINMQNTSNLSQLFYQAGLGKFSEVTRNLYRHIRDATVLKADTFIVGELAIEAFRQGKQIKRFVVDPFERHFTTTYREQLLLILEVDMVVAKHLKVREQTSRKIICSLNLE